MKTYLLFIFVLISTISFAQKGEIVKTEDGRRIFLKSDFTWEFIDTADSTSYSTTQKLLKPINKNACQLGAGYEEPKLDNRIQSKLKRGHATIAYVKKKAAKDNDCTVEEVVLLSFSEQLKKGVYHFCANGTKATYKRLGHTIIKAPSVFLK